jgi:Metallo-beta-lactamase superfamily
MRGPGTGWAARSDVRFRAGRIDAVWGVGLQDGRAVVIKAHRTPADLDAAQATIDAQRALAAAGFPCPVPLSGPDEVKGRVLTAETLIVGAMPNGRNPAIRRLLAAGLFRHIEILRGHPDLIDRAGSGPSWSSLPSDGGPVPGEIVEHQAHAIGHAAVLLADRGVLLAGDMLSDVLIPLLDPRRPDQVGAYETALERLGEAARHVDVLVPGHGAVAEGPEVAARLAADHAYIDALRRGEEPVDARLGQDWLSGPHQSNLEQARHSSG